MANPALSRDKKTTKIAVLGAGSWGCTLARLFTLAGKDVSLWSKDADKARRLNENRIIEKPLSIELPSPLEITADLEKCIADKQILVFCCTSQSMRSVASKVKAILKRSSLVDTSQAPGNTIKARDNAMARPVLVSAVKGLEIESFYRMSQILEDILGEFPICSLSGPNLAAEILSGMPAASVIACKDPDVARYVQKELTMPSLRLYSNIDLVGVELGGSFKNVIAIAAGGVDGLCLGYNAKAALMTRGLAEMTRLAVLLGANSNTMSGLAGLGDLIATCAGPLSRNYQLGYNIARGASLSSVEANLGAVAEGVTTAYAVCELALTLNIELPIALQVQSALKEELSPQQAIMNLMTRPLVSE